MGAICSDLEGLTMTSGAIKAGLPNIGSPLQDCEQSIPFISIDVEAFEFDQSISTEIGLSQFDTADIAGAQPGANGNEWAANIQSRHFRIIENSHHINRKYVEGCLDKFDFGQSEWIHKQQVVEILEGCFQSSRSTRSRSSSKACKVVLTAHDIAADVKYLVGAGFNVLQKSLTL